MKRKYPNLSQPVKIGNVVFRNRMFSAPMGGTHITADGVIGQDSTAFYELRAKGGAAAVTVSELMVHPETDGSHAYHLDLKIPGALYGFAHTADSIRRHGAVPSVELSHSGQYSGTYMADKDSKLQLHQYGPSEGVRKDGVPIKELSKEMIDEIVKAYGDSAALAKRAGFQMIMVHGGHGWLINQFFSPFFNRRKDEYGGTLENRVRFAKEVLASVRANVGPGFPIEFRFSGSELFKGGYNLNEGIEIAKLLEDDIDLLHVSAGTYQTGFGITHPSMFIPHGNNVYLAAAIKKHVKVPVATIGGLNHPEMMEEIIASGKADVVEMARALLADHELPRKVLMNRDDEILHCLRCFVCMAERATTTTRRCAINPLIGREVAGIEIHRAIHPLKVMIAGAGPGGLRAAITAARRGHRVILVEEQNEAGGILNCESAIPFKREMYELGKTMERIARKEGVDIRLNTKFSSEYAENEAVDAVILAIGSEPVIPPIPGIDGENVMVVNDYHRMQDSVAESAVIIGGGLSGAELSVHLANEGRKVSLIEMQEELAKDSNVRHRPLLLQEIEQKVSAYTGMRAVEITEDGVFCENRDGEKILVEGKTVICAVGQKSRNTMDYLDAAPFVRCIGDCVRPSNITNAVYLGYHAALDL